MTMYIPNHGAVTGNTPMTALSSFRANDGSRLNVPASYQCTHSHRITTEKSTFGM